MEKPLEFYLIETNLFNLENVGFNLENVGLYKEKYTLNFLVYL